MRYLVGFVFLLLALGTLRTVGCGDADLCGGCDDADPCTEDRCEYDPEDPSWDFSLCQSEDPEDYRCHHYRRADGSPCGGDNVCVDGTCSENLCAGCEDDGNSCTIDCDYRTGACDYVPLPDGDSCKGEQNNGRCYGGVCIVCEELDCDDGDLCTTDQCDDRSGCVNYPVHCADHDDCTADLCDPATGECFYPPNEGRGCRVSEGVTGWSYGHFIGVCEGYTCTGQPCDIQPTEEYPCPAPVGEPLWRTYVCCPLPSDHVGKPYCAIDETCEELVWGPLCEEICPDTSSNFVRQMMCVRAHGDCALVDQCEAECPRDQWECVWNDGVCP